MTIACEPGDLLSKDAAILLGEVVTVERRRDVTFVGLDIGWNVNCAYFIYRFAQEIVVCRAAGAARTEIVTVAGHINEAGDVFAEDYPMPPVAEGDMVATLNAGGYLQAMSSTHCLRPMGERRLPRPLALRLVRAPQLGRASISTRMSGRVSSRWSTYCGYLRTEGGDDARVVRPHPARRASARPSQRSQREPRPVLVPPIDEDGHARIRGDVADASERGGVVAGASACRRSASRGPAGPASMTKQIGTGRGRPSGAIVTRTARRAVSEERTLRRGQDRVGLGHRAYHRAVVRGPSARTLRGMSRRRWLVVGGIVVAGSIVIGVLTRGDGRGAARSTRAHPRPTRSVPTAYRRPRAPTPSPTALRPQSPTPTTRPTPPRSLAPTAPPRATGDPRLAYAAFLLRVNDDRATVDGLNRALSTAAEAQDPKAVTTASVAILDFVDGERDWLREHPPADCYAAAHAVGQRDARRLRHGGRPVHPLGGDRWRAVGPGRARAMRSTRPTRPAMP